MGSVRNFEVGGMCHTRRASRLEPPERSDRRQGILLCRNWPRNSRLIFCDRRPAEILGKSRDLSASLAAYGTNANEVFYANTNGNTNFLGKSGVAVGVKYSF